MINKKTIALPDLEYYNTHYSRLKAKALREDNMCVFQENPQNTDTSANYIVCAQAIAEHLKQVSIHAEVKGGMDEFGTWVQINVENVTPAQINDIQKIKAKFESNLELERKDRPKSQRNKMKVDYISVNVKYTKDFKEKVWSWVQRKFENDMGKLPKQYEQLDQYHVGRNSHIPAFRMIELAIFDRIKNTSFWKEAL